MVVLRVSRWVRSAMVVLAALGVIFLVARVFAPDGGPPSEPADVLRFAPPAAFPDLDLGPIRIEDTPEAIARLRGGPLDPDITGTVAFFAAGGGALVAVWVEGLPPYQPASGEQPPVGPHGFHIHESGSCAVGNPQDPFQAAGGHYAPDGDPHGDHAGDLPVLFANLGERGFASMAVFTDEFRPRDVIGRSVLIHRNPDDFRTQPAGASGLRLACGVIEPFRR